MTDGLPPGFTLVEPDAGLPSGFKLLPPEPSPQQQRLEQVRGQLGSLPAPVNLSFVRPSEEKAALEAQRERRRLEGELQLLESNVQIGEAPVEARVKSGLGLNRLQGYQAALGPGYEVKELTSEGPYKGEIVYRKGTEGPFTTVRNPEGILQPFDFAARGRDIQSLRYTTPPEALGALGAAAATAFGGGGFPLMASRAFMGGAAGRAAGEVQRLLSGREAGIIPPDFGKADIIAEAARLGAEQGLQEMGGVALYSMFKALQGRGMPNLGDLTPQMIDQALASLKAKVGPAGEKLLTIGDVLAELGKTNEAALFKSLEETIAKRAKSPFQAQFAERAAAKEAAASERFQGVLPEGATPPSVNVQQLGRQVEAAAPGIEQFTAEAGAVAGPMRMAREDLARSIRESLQKAEEQAQAPIKAGYTRLESETSGFTTQASDTGAMAETLGKDFAERIFPSLSKDNRRLVGEAVKNLYEEVPGPDGKPTMQLKEVTFDQLQKAVSDVRTAIREKGKGEWTGELRQLLDIEDALVKDRNRILQQSGGQDAIDRINALDASWREVKDKFRRGELASSFRVKATESRATTADNFLEKLTMDRDALEAALPNLFPREKEGLRSMFIMQLSDLAPQYGTATGREIRQAAVEEALRRADSPASLLFSPAEIDRLAKGAQLQQVRRVLGVNDRQDFGSWFNQFYNAQNIDQASTLYSRLGASNPAVADAVRGMVRQRLYDDLAIEGPQGGKVLDMARFEKLMSDPQKLQWLQRSLGSDFAVRLRAVANATEALFPSGPRLVLGEKAEVPTTALAAVVKTARAIKGPLSREQRLITYAQGVANAEIQQRIARAILDPEYFARILRASQNTGAGRASAATIGFILGEGGGLLDNDQDTWFPTLAQTVSKTYDNMIGAPR